MNEHSGPIYSLTYIGHAILKRINQIWKRYLDWIKNMKLVIQNGHLVTMVTCNLESQVRVTDIFNWLSEHPNIYYWHDLTILASLVSSIYWISRWPSDLEKIGQLYLNRLLKLHIMISTEFGKRSCNPSLVSVLELLNGHTQMPRHTITQVIVTTIAPSQSLVAC